MKRFLAAFDLDQTLLSVNSSYVFGRFLYKKKYFSFFDMFYVVVCYTLHKRGLLTIKRVHEIIFKHIFRGRSLVRLKDMVTEFLSLHFEKMLYAPVVDRLKKEMDQGHQVVILSSSPHFLVGPIAKRLGVECWESSHYDVDEKGCFNEISYLMQGKEKASFVLSLAEKLGISRKNITAYSDSVHDLPLLEVAEKAIAVAPDRLLKAICKERNWEVI